MASVSDLSSPISYKSKSIKFMRWLISKAQALKITEKLHHKFDSSEAIDESTLTTRDMKAIAEAISKAPASDRAVPLEIQYLLKDVIHARKEAAAWYKTFAATVGSQDIESDRGHQRFIETLVEISDVLSNLGAENVMKAKAPQYEKEVDRSYGNNMAPIQASTLDLANAFQHLEVFDLNIEELEIENAAPDASEQSAERKPIPSTAETNKLSKIDSEELFCHIFDFFQDFRRTKTLIRNVWEKYRRRQLSLITATTVTQNAFYLYMDKVEAFCRGAMGLVSFELITRFLWFHLHNKESPRVEKSSEQDALSPLNEEETDLFCYRTYNTMVEFFQTATKTKLEGAQIRDLPELPPHPLLEAVGKDVQLLRLLPELNSLARCSPAAKQSTALGDVMDVLCCWGEEIQAAGVVCISTFDIVMFSLQIEIYQALGDDIARPFEELQTYGERIVGSLSSWMKFSRASLSHGNTDWRKPFDDSTFRLLKAVAKVTKRDCVAEAKAASGIQRDDQPSFHLMKQHPMLCGEMIVVVNFLYHIDSTRMLDASFMFTCAAHMYNACRKSGALQKSWTDMEALIVQQGERHIFVGEAPKKPAQFSARLLLAVGASLQYVSGLNKQAAPNQRKRKVLRGTGGEGHRNHLEVSSLYKVFLEKSARHKMCTTLDWSGSRMLRRAIAQSYVDSLPKASSALTYKRMSWVEVDPITVLEMLADRMNEEESSITFDYVSFMQRCWKMLEAAWEATVDGVNAPRDIEALDTRDRLRSMVDQILSTAEVIGWLPLKMASNGVAEFIEKEGDVEMKAARKLWKEES